LRSLRFIGAVENANLPEELTEVRKGTEPVSIFYERDS